MLFVDDNYLTVRKHDNSNMEIPDEKTRVVCAARVYKTSS